MQEERPQQYKSWIWQGHSSDLREWFDWQARGKQRKRAATWKWAREAFLGMRLAQHGKWQRDNPEWETGDSGVEEVVSGVDVLGTWGLDLGPECRCKKEAENMVTVWRWVILSVFPFFFSPSDRETVLCRIERELWRFERSEILK